MSEQANHRREEIIVSLAMETLQSFGEFQFVAWGSSMVPSLFPGDTLIIRRAAPEDACNGDVVLFARKGRFHAHRLVDRKMAADGPIQLITRGDSLDKNDPPFSESELLGRVTAVLRRGKRIELDRHPACGPTAPSMGGAALGRQREMVAAMAFAARAALAEFDLHPQSPD